MLDSCSLLVYIKQRAETTYEYRKVPKLDLKSAHEYWDEYDDPMIYRVVSFMEAMEHWTKDGDPKLEAAIDRFGDALDPINKYPTGEESKFTKLASFLKMPRLLRMLQAVDQIEPGSASKILMYTEENGSKDKPAALFLRRNIVFERLRLLSRVFSPERFSIVLKALQNE